MPLPKDLAKLLKKQFGKDVIQKASAQRVKSDVRLSSGSINYDRALGGGWVRGRWHTLYGSYSGGKSLTTLKGIAMLQKMCVVCMRPAQDCLCTAGPTEPSCIYISTENDFDDAWARHLGVDTDSLLIHHPSHGEEALDLCEVLIRSGSVDLIAIDSLALLVPKKVIEESTGKSLVAEQARMLGKGMQKLMSALTVINSGEGRPTTLLATNQTRVDVSVMFGDNTKKPGGSAPEFAAATETRFSRQKVDYPKKKKDSPLPQDIPSIAIMRPKVTKNKTAIPHQKAEFNVRFLPTKHLHKGDIDELIWIMDALITQEILVRESSSKWLIFDEVFARKCDIEARLATDFSFWFKVRESLLKELIV